MNTGQKHGFNCLPYSFGADESSISRLPGKRICIIRFFIICTIEYKNKGNDRVESYYQNKFVRTTNHVYDTEK